MYSELEGKVALVTGASRGFGKAIALRLAKEGVSVIINYRRSRSEAESVMQEIDKNGGEAIAIKADVGKEDKVIGMFEVIKSEFGRCDIVIANASFGVPGNIMDSSHKHWDSTMAATARYIMQCAQLAVPLMNDWGRIITLSSYGNQRILPNYGVVGPAKGAVESLTRSLALELGPKNIRVNGIMPGISKTKSLMAIPNAEDMLQYATERSPVKKLVTPEDVANTAAFLCSDQASMINGQFIIVDGGTFCMG